MKIIQIIIVSSIYLISEIAIIIFIQGLVYQVMGFSIYKWMMGLFCKAKKKTNNRKKINIHKNLLTIQIRKNIFKVNKRVMKKCCSISIKFLKIKRGIKFQLNIIL